MAKGILLGVLMQCVSAVGYIVIVNITSIESEAFRSGLMVCCAAVVALLVTVYTVLTGQQSLSAIQPREYLYIAIGSVIVMFVDQMVYFVGVKLSNMTTMAYTMLAYPLISLGLELLLGRIKPSSLGSHDLGGFLLLPAGYVVIMTKPQVP